KLEKEETACRRVASGSQAQCNGAQRIEGSLGAHAQCAVGIDGAEPMLIRAFEVAHRPASVLFAEARHQRGTMMNDLQVILLLEKIDPSPIDSGPGFTHGVADVV